MKKLTLTSLILSALLLIGCTNQPKDETLSDGTFHAVGLNLTGTINVDVTIENHRIVEVSVMEKLKTYAKERGATVSGIISLWIRQNCD